ncbi:hypothetical protein NDU88_002208 [Pleurodeles waltl]|uniref:Uncharacterized protein n=1 Tax=Pleurodeles waltl TaxID=8319 RepID=A0AAV7SAY7_PLEWA|nr:hypothetical protein NDU88_002208 [Pleurodeles waltl]
MLHAEVHSNTQRPFFHLPTTTDNDRHNGNLADPESDELRMRTERGVVSTDSLIRAPLRSDPPSPMTAVLPLEGWPAGLGLLLVCARGLKNNRAGDRSQSDAVCRLTSAAAVRRGHTGTTATSASYLVARVLRQWRPHPPRPREHSRASLLGNRVLLAKFGSPREATGMAPTMHWNSLK